MSNITIKKEELPIPYVCYDYCGYIPLFSYDDTFKEFYICECFKPTFYAIFEMGLIKELPDLLKEFFIKHHVNSYEDAINKLPFKPHICHECNKKTPQKVWSHNISSGLGWGQYKDSYANIKKQVWPYYQKRMVAYGKPPQFLKTHYNLCPSKLWNIFLKECGIPCYDLHEILSNENIRNLKRTSISFVDQSSANSMLNIANDYIGLELNKAFGNTLVRHKHEAELGYILREIFPEKTIITHYSPAFLDNLELDFFIPDLKLAFEYQGEQHYKIVDHFGGKNKLLIQQEHDERKKKLAKRANINLIEISYDDPLTKDFVYNKIKTIPSLVNNDNHFHHVLYKNISNKKLSYIQQEKIEFPQLYNKDKELVKIYSNFDFDKAIKLIENGANANVLFFTEEQILPKDINAFYGANLFLLSCAYMSDFKKWENFANTFIKNNGNIFKEDISKNNAIHYALKNKKLSHKILEQLLEYNLYLDWAYIVNRGLWGNIPNLDNILGILTNYLIKHRNYVSNLEVKFLMRLIVNHKRQDLFTLMSKHIINSEIKKVLFSSLFSEGSIDFIKNNKEYIIENKELITKEIYISIPRWGNELKDKLIFLNSIAPLKQEETGEVFLYFIRCGEIDEDILQFMVSLNWNFSAIDKEGKNALIHIYEKPQRNANILAKILIEKYNLDVNSPDITTGKTAAMYAAKSGWRFLQNIIKYADLDIKDKRKRTLKDFCNSDTLKNLNDYMKSVNKY